MAMLQWNHCCYVLVNTDWLITENASVLREVECTWRAFECYLPSHKVVVIPSGRLLTSEVNVNKKINNIEIPPTKTHCLHAVDTLKPWFIMFYRIYMIYRSKQWPFGKLFCLGQRLLSIWPHLNQGSWLVQLAAMLCLSLKPCWQHGYIFHWQA